MMTYITRIILLFFIILSYSLTVYSQGYLQFDGGFENWHIDTLYTAPDYWAHSNSADDEEQSVTQIPDATSGNYALRLKTIKSGDAADLGDNINDSLKPGAVSLTSVAFNASYTYKGLTEFLFTTPGQTDTYSSSHGIHYTDKPAQLSGDFNYNIAQGDSAIIQVLFTQEDSIVSYNRFWLSGNSNGWKNETFDIQGFDGNPDSVYISMASSDPTQRSGIQTGSELLIDALSFDTGEPITNGGFENRTFLTEDLPDHWPLHYNYFISVIDKTLYRTPDSYSGEYAARLKGETFLGNVDTSIFYNDTHIMQGGYPIDNGAPQYINGHYKLSPSRPEDDTAAGVLIYLKKGNSYLDSTTVVFNTSQDYQGFSKAIRNRTNQEADTIQILIISNHTDNILTVDNLSLTDEPAATNNKRSQSSFSVYPNPASGKVHLKLNNHPGEKAALKVLNTHGKIIFNKSLSGNRATVNLNNHQPGIYYLRVRTKAKTYRKKIIVQQ